jgi:hypothetical protein
MPDARKDVANSREAGNTVDLMVNVGEILVDRFGPVLASTARQQGAA